MTLSAHDFIEVKDRRWCICCDLFQQKEPGAAFFPTPRNPCPRNTPYAEMMDRREARRADT